MGNKYIIMLTVPIIGNILRILYVVYYIKREQDGNACGNYPRRAAGYAVF